jgi:hypothetical protein
VFFGFSRQNKSRKCTRRPRPRLWHGLLMPMRHVATLCVNTFASWFASSIHPLPGSASPGTSHSPSSSSLFGSYVLRPIPSQRRLYVPSWSHPRPNETHRLSLPGFTPSRHRQTRRGRLYDSSRRSHLTFSKKPSSSPDFRSVRVIRLRRISMPCHSNRGSRTTAQVTTVPSS